MSDIIEKAHYYAKQGYMPTPLRGKSPRLNDWHRAHLTADQIGKVWTAEDNVGLVMGKLGGNLADIDLDCREARAIALEFLRGDLYPKTAFGRGGIMTHAIYVSHGATSYAIKDKHTGESIIELRANNASGSGGSCTMFPPSRHPDTGEQLAFINETQPLKADPKRLVEVCKLIAVAVLMIRYWPGEGARHDAALCFAGALVQSKLPEAVADHLWRVVITQAEPDDHKAQQDRQRCIKDSRKQHDAKQPVRGLSGLQDAGVPNAIINQLADLLDIRVGSKDYASIIEEMRRKHAVVNYGGSPVVITENYEPDLERSKFDIQRFQDFAQLYNNVFVDAYDPIADDIRTMKAGRAFLEDPDRPQYDGTVLYPSGNVWDRGAPISMEKDGETRSYFNLWCGFTRVPQAGDWSLFREHLFVNICQRDEEQFAYLLGWMATKVQKPHLPSGVALVLRGAKGTGKNVFADTFGIIFGTHYFSAARGDSLTGKFNAHLETCCLLLSNEAVWAGSHKDEGALKALITDDIAEYQPKFVNSKQGRNHCSVILLANAEWVVPASMDERRFCVFTMGEEHMQDHDYFAAIERQMQSGGHQAMLFDLLAQDVSDFNVYAAPKTQGLAEQVIESLESVEAWVLDSLSDGVIAGSALIDRDSVATPWDYGGDEGSVHFTEKLGRAYDTWCRAKGRRDIMSGRKFCMRLRKLFTVDGKSWVVNAKEAKDQGTAKVRYRLPPLNVARELFSKKLGSQVDWGEDDAVIVSGESNPKADDVDWGDEDVMDFLAKTLTEKLE